MGLRDQAAPPPRGRSRRRVPPLPQRAVAPSGRPPREHHAVDRRQRKGTCRATRSSERWPTSLDSPHRLAPRHVVGDVKPYFPLTSGLRDVAAPSPNLHAEQFRHADLLPVLHRSRLPGRVSTTAPVPGHPPDTKRRQPSRVEAHDGRRRRQADSRHQRRRPHGLPGHEQPDADGGYDDQSLRDHGAKLMATERRLTGSGEHADMGPGCTRAWFPG
jgi:hypothetical protein